MGEAANAPFCSDPPARGKKGSQFGLAAASPVSIGQTAGFLEYAHKHRFC